jgi:hypothetical protein
MPVPPSELTAEYRIDGPEEAATAALDVAGPTGLAREAGPGLTALSGSREEVLQALDEVVQAALDAGAHEIDVRLVRGSTQ